MTLSRIKSRERPKSAPYLRLKKTRKPLFLQLETTKALKKLKSEKKNFRIFFDFFSKIPVSRIVPKNVKGGRFLSHVRRFRCVENDVLSTYCHSPLPVWVAIADEWGSEEAMGATCDSPNGISTTNLKTLSQYLK